MYTYKFTKKPNKNDFKALVTSNLVYLFQRIVIEGTRAII